MYVVKTPWWLRALYPSLVWRMPAEENNVYLSFDDGPHPQATPFVLDQLEKYNAKATFFCIGKNVVAHPSIYDEILRRGHSAGNHTYNHVNGWKVNDAIYFDEVRQTQELVRSDLFRPPYGRISRSQIRQLQSAESALRIIMWSVLSADFDTALTGEQCLQNVIKHTRPGSILLFHDSEKAWPRMSHSLPRVLQYFSERGYKFEGM